MKVPVWVRLKWNYFYFAFNFHSFSSSFLDFWKCQRHFFADFLVRNLYLRSIAFWCCHRQYMYVTQLTNIYRLTPVRNHSYAYRRHASLIGYNLNSPCGAMQHDSNRGNSFGSKNIWWRWVTENANTKKCHGIRSTLGFNVKYILCFTYWHRAVPIKIIFIWNSVWLGWIFGNKSVHYSSHDSHVSFRNSHKLVHL